MPTWSFVIGNQYLWSTSILPSSIFEPGGMLGAMHRPNERFSGSDFEVEGIGIEQYVCLSRESRTSKECAVY